MTELNVNKQQIVRVTIDTEKENIDAIKKNFDEETANTIFEGVDKNGNGIVDDGAELDTFKANLKKSGYKIEGEAEQSAKPAADENGQSRAYNSTIQNMRNRYDADNLKGNFKQEETDLHPVVSGDNLTKIAKKALQDEGLEVTPRALNDRIAQIAAVNGLNNVNNIPVGKKLIVHLTDTAVTSVKANEGQNSAQVLGGAAPVRASQGAPENHPAEQTGNRPADQAEQGQVVQSQVGPSSIKIEKSLEEEGFKATEEEVSKDGFEPALADDDEITKYTKGEGEEAEVAFEITYSDGSKIRANSEDDLKAKHKEFTDTKAEIKDLKEVPEVPEDGTDEEKAAAEAEKAKVEAENAQTQATNAAAVRKMIELSGGDLKVIENILNDEYQNGRLSDADRAELVNDLLKTKNAEVVDIIINKIDAGNLIENQSSAETVIALYQEIRAKENAGVRLTDEEIALKDTLTNKINGDYPRLYTISADSENGVVEKNLQYDTEGETFYSHSDADGKVWKASTPEALDEFVAKLNAYKAETDETRKAELKAEILGTTDPQVARSILENRDTFGLVSTDIAEFIKSWDMYVLQDLAIPDTIEDGEDRAVVEAVVERIEELYTSEERTKGDIANARYLDKAFAWIDKLGDTTVGEGEEAVTTTKAQRKQAILETYFEKTETEEGEGENKTTTVTYTFKPNRKPTPEEMSALYNAIKESDDWSEMGVSIIDTFTVEDMGHGRLSEIFENFSDNLESMDAAIVNKYAEFAEALETEEDVLDFIEKIKDKKHYAPYDKIMEKFPESEEVKLKLMKNVSVESKISTENLVTLLTQCMQVAENGTVTFDRNKLPEGIELADVIKALTTYDAGEENISAEEKTARETLNKYFDATLKTLDKADFGFITQLYNNGGKAGKIRNRVGELVEAEIKKGDNADKEFINKVLGGNTSIIPWDKFNGHEDILAEFYCNPPEGVDNRNFQAVLLNGVYDTPDKKAALVGKCSLDKNESLIRDIVVTTNTNITQKLYDALIKVGAFEEIGVGMIKRFDKTNGLYRMYRDEESGNFYIGGVSESEIAKRLYENIDETDDKKLQIKYVQTYGKMDPATVVKLFKEYKGIEGNNEGLLEALDYEKDGASLADMMGLVQKVVAYAKQKGKANTPQFQALISKMNGFKEFFANADGSEPEAVDANNAATLGFTERAQKRDFTNWGGTLISWAGYNPAEDFDDLVMELIKVCEG